ncbi:TolC family protein [Acetohalobium arabaticum]|uniref:Outer membrane efflux protein n=1 Tax=Acetohalobium arabaticum (strain ATCC 49924 / DSM 5501 / Z-7288) TaxID=574087 RepID=D9QSF8_ACEAZ|nr:TolC family protein [Acetohalobium arabaticum]ADL13421.1 hypothetical protein Acear_1920 [Acetohalobium arabaticum DSM 5501]
MRRKRKGLIIVIICLTLLVLISNLVLAGSGEKLNVIETINLVLKENHELQIAKLELANAEIEYQKSQANNLTAQSRAAELEAKANLLQAQNQYYETQADLIKEGLTKYGAVRLAKQNIAVKQTEKRLEKLRLDKIKTQLKQGHKNNLDLIEQMNEYQDVEVNFNQAEDTYQQALRELKFIINYNEEKNLELQPLTAVELWQITEQEVLQCGLESSLELKLAAERIAAAKQKLTKLKQIATPKLELKTAENELQIAKLDKNSIKREVKTALYSNYDDFKHMIKQLNLRAENLSEVRENQKRIAQQQKKGLASREELLAVEVQLLQAKYDYQSAVVDYYSWQLELKVAMQEEVEGLLDALPEK